MHSAVRVNPTVQVQVLPLVTNYQSNRFEIPLFDLVYASFYRYKESDKMEEKLFLTFEVGKPFPGEVPLPFGSCGRMKIIFNQVYDRYSTLSSHPFQGRAHFPPWKPL